MQAARVLAALLLCLSVFPLLRAEAQTRPDSASSGPVTARYQEPPTLTEVRKRIQQELGRLDADVARAAQALSRTGLSGPGARAVLAQLVRRQPLVIDAATVDTAGKMVILEPEPFRKHEGADISDQPQVRRIQRTHRPVLSQVIRLVEGMDAVDLQHPVILPDRKFGGSVSAVFPAEKLIAACAPKGLGGLDLFVYVLQRDGRVLYDPDADEVGRNIFTDPVYGPYPALQKLSRRIVQDRSGYGTYEFPATGGARVVRKETFWTTVELHGTEWRVAIAREVASGSLPVERSGSGRKSKADDALRRLAGDGDLRQRMLGRDYTGVHRLLQGLFEEHPGLYAVQWIDAHGVARGGYPAENSLMDYDFRVNRYPDDAEFLRVVRNGNEATLVQPLIEGKKGRFFLVPVHSGSTYLGMVYTIRLEP